MTTTARREGDNIIITVPVAEAHALRVALQPCPCKSAKSTATTDIRARLARGIGMAIERQTATQTKD